MNDNTLTLCILCFISQYTEFLVAHRYICFKGLLTRVVLSEEMALLLQDFNILLLSMVLYFYDTLL